LSVAAPGRRAATQRTQVAFYCVADARYFLGAVAMLNSLRLVGHSEPVFIYDCGLTPEQRRLLAPHATIVPASSDSPPWLLKAGAPLSHPAEVMVLLDADMVVTRTLQEPIEKARQGYVVAVEHGSERFVPQWGELLNLGPVRRRTYLSSSLVFFSRPVGGEVLHLMEERKDLVDFELSYWRQNIPDYPFLYGDQDVLNAILASRVEPDRIAVLDRRLEAIPPFEGLRVVDEQALRCAYADGTEPYAVHHYTAKPWLEETPYGVYTQLLVRCLVGGDVALKMRRRELPPHLRRRLRLVARVRALRERRARGGG
jgi:hypothetical protein